MSKYNYANGWDSGRRRTFQNYNGWSDKTDTKAPGSSGKIIEVGSGCSVTMTNTEIDELKDPKQKLMEMNPSASFSVELPYNGNGNLFQVRTEIFGEMFYGRATNEDEAMEKCCKKAIKCIVQRSAQTATTTANLNTGGSKTLKTVDKGLRSIRSSGFNDCQTIDKSSKSAGFTSKTVISSSRMDGRAKTLGSHDKRSEREKELRHGILGGVLDCVDAWSRNLKGATCTPRSVTKPRSLQSNEISQRRVDDGNVAAGKPRGSRRGGQPQPDARGGISSRQNLTPVNKVGRPSSSSSYETELAPSMATSDTLDEEREDNSASGSIILDWKYKQIPIKNAVMMLNEMFPPPVAPQYKVTSQTGPPNNPTFTMVCCIKDETFVGEGKSKKEAKLACSQKAIEAICGAKVSEMRVVPEKSNPRASCDLDDWMELEGKNPVSILNELYPGIQYQLVSTSGPSHAPLFIIKASLNDVAFEGSGKSKKDAKLNASKALLVHLHKVGFNPLTGVMMSTQQDNREAAAGHSLADKIGQLVSAKYQALFGSTTYSKRRVMAGVVMTRDWGDGEDVDLKDEDSAEVICVSSGTKCINGEQLSLEGCVVNDSHAEIVTRRCMMLFFYKQLQKLANQEDSIFRYGDDGIAELKDGIDFHLFITTSPCGDARIFSLHEASNLNTNNSSSATMLTEPKVMEKSQSTTCLPDTATTALDKNSSSSMKDLLIFEDVQSNPEMTISAKNPNEESGIFTDQMSPEKSDFEPENSNSDTFQDSRVHVNNNYIDKANQSTCLGESIIEVEDLVNENQVENIDVPNLGVLFEIGDSTSNLDVGVVDCDGDKLEALTGERKVRERRPPADSSKGMLRSKIECGMGTVPIKPTLTIQTWDGILSGDRLLTMACSDKILRWNVIGFQGALLTLFMRPIYLKSITVGSKFHPGHMKRALYERIVDHVKELPPGYHFNVPLLFATTSPETRQATKAHDYSVNWIIDQGQPEIVNGSTGKTINENTSRLSKRSLFEEFLSVSSLLNKSMQLDSPVRYSEVKQLAEDYQRAKSQVFSALVSAGCGHWVEKPIEQDQFSL